MWEKPENQNIDQVLCVYLAHLNALLEKAGISQQVQGAILYKNSDNCDIDCCKEQTCDYCDAYGDEYAMISNSSILQKQMNNLVDSIEKYHISEGRVYKRVNESYLEYLKYISGSVYGNIYLFIKLRYSATGSKLVNCTTDEWDEFTIVPTLANYIVMQYLSEVHLPSIPNMQPRYVTDQLLLVAGNTFVAKLLEGFVVGNQNFVSDLNIISSLVYESQVNAGNIVLLHQSLHINSLKDEFLNDSFEENAIEQPRVIHLSLQFTEPVSMTNHKRVRKLFQIATEDTYLVSDGSYIYGITTKGALQEQTVDRYMLISIRGPLKWELYEYQIIQPKEKTLHVIYDSTCFKVKKKPAYTEEITNKLNILLNYLSSRAITCPPEPCGRCEYGQACVSISKNELKDHSAMVKNIVEIVRLAINQKHGTTIVFSMCAKEEVARLNRTSFRIEATPLNNNKKIIKQITAIDGAVMCDLCGVCYAIGVILDGKTVRETTDDTPKDNSISEIMVEDISRGARYNSAIRYKNANPCSIICIVSEDGDVNII